MKNKIIKKGFTLAEVLITLGIIGVVAAMTIPTLMAIYQKKQTATRLKKAYSIIQQAVRLSQDDNGGVESWDSTLRGSVFFHRYIADYVKYVDEYTSAELMTKAPRTLLNGNAYTGTTYGRDNTTSAHFTLLDGTLITMNLDSGSEKGLWVGIDVNGLSQPNRIGIDTFLFFLSSEYGLRPLGDPGTPETWNYGTYERTKVGPNGTKGCACSSKKNGYWCAALVFYDGWEMESDYPWKTK